MLKTNILIPVLFVAALLGACNTPASNKNASLVTDSSSSISNNARIEVLLKEKCLPCHSLNMRMVGPPLIVFTDTAGKLTKKYKADGITHKNVSISFHELQQIENYVMSLKNGYTN